MLQVTAIGIISIGVVLVLLLGEIDLSIGAVSGLCAGVMAVLTVKHGWYADARDPRRPRWPARRSASDQRLHRTFFGIPSFVVTLAGLIAWQGALLLVLGDTGTINLPPSVITDLTSTFYGAGVGMDPRRGRDGRHAGSRAARRRRRQRAGLEPLPWRGSCSARCSSVRRCSSAVAILLSDRGVPLAV